MSLTLFDIHCLSVPVCSTEERIITLDFDWSLEGDLKDAPGPLFLARIVKRSLQRVTHKLLSKLEGLASHVHFLEAGAPVDSLLLPCECSWEFPTSEFPVVHLHAQRDMEPFAGELACWVRLARNEPGPSEAPRRRSQDKRGQESLQEIQEAASTKEAGESSALATQPSEKRVRTTELETAPTASKVEMEDGAAWQHLAAYRHRTAMHCFCEPMTHHIISYLIMNHQRSSKQRQ